MTPTNIPDDINIELLLSYFTEGSCKVTFGGLHKRNTYNDLIALEEAPNDTLQLTVGRTSLYDTLPEIMFHPVDRFDNLTYGEEFEQEYERQKHEEENAHVLFDPIDLYLLRLRLMVRKRINEYAETNNVMIDILGDKLAETQRENRFVRKAIRFLPFCKNIRGNKTHLTLLLRKIFMEEGIGISPIEEPVSYSDPEPRYNTCLDSDIDGLFIGNSFDEQTMTYEICFWPESECNDHFLHFIDEVETFRSFLQDYFIAIGETIRFNIVQDAAPVCLSDETRFNYMNYNMNI